ncbi:Diaminopimelate decarboxylase [ANME-1 cluster archaeon GoMg2]|nr:Diaminopimelate decarboxylase [ANME-1 cluster archaeon GoMg2]
MFGTLISGVKEDDLVSLAEEYGTPLFVYCQKQLENNLNNLKKGLPDRARIAYSIKANPNPDIIRFFFDSGINVEAASEGELHLALASGVSGNKVMVGGPAKSASIIKLALQNHIKTINVESENENQTVLRVSQSLGLFPRILLRINPSAVQGSMGLAMGGRPSQFGIDEYKVVDLLKRLSYNSKNTLYGVFMYAGSQIFDEKIIAENTEHLFALAKKISNTISAPLQMLDFGGGFGVPESLGQRPLDMGKLRVLLDNVFKAYAKDSFCENTECIFESGRFLTASAGIYISRVLDKKESQDKHFLITDGGINHIGIRQKCYRTHEPEIITLHNSYLKKNSFTIVGPTCTPIDTTHKCAELPDIEVGDYIAMLNMGAYALSYSPVYFCGHGPAAEILIEPNGNRKLIRSRTFGIASCGTGFRLESISTPYVGRR